MEIKVFGFILIGLVGAVSCYAGVHDEAEKQADPILQRHGEMLEHLLKMRQDEEKSNGIGLAPEAGEVSEEKCKDLFINTPDSEFEDRAHELLGASHQSQAKLCKEWWENFVRESASQVDSLDRDTVKSIIKDISEAKDTSDGVLRLMESSSGEKLSKATSHEKFDEIFDKYIAEPCSRYMERMHGAWKAANKYMFLVSQLDTKTNIDPNLLELTQSYMTCKSISGSEDSDQSGTLPGGYLREFIRHKLMTN